MEVEDATRNPPREPAALSSSSPLGLLGDRRAPIAILALAIFASAIWLISADSHLTFIADDWDFLVKRQGASLNTFLEPFKDNTAIGPALFFKAWLALFGMGSALPYYLASIAMFLASAILFFVYLRRRVEVWLALIGAVSILFLGAAFEDLLWISPINFFGSMVAGLGMLLALDREDQNGDALACVLLIISIAFSSLGLAFAAGAVVDVALGRKSRFVRAYVVIMPLLLYLVWLAGWGHTAQSYVTAHNLEHLPGYVFSAAGAGVTSLLGLASNDGSEPSQPHLIWGKLVLVAALLLGAYRVYRQGRISRGLVVACVIALAFWVLAGLKPNLENPAHTPEHFPTSSRYQYISAVFLLLIAAELLRGLRVPKLAVGAAAVVAALAVWGGVSLLQREYTERWRPASESLRSSLSAVQIAGPAAKPSFPVSFPPAVVVSARTYLAAVREHGSPAYSEADLAAKAEPERASADLTIAQAEGLRLRGPGRSQRTIACQALRASAEGGSGVTLLHGGFTLTNESHLAVEILLSRFADGPSVDLGPLPAGQKTALRIPSDTSSRPWGLDLRGTGAVRLCTTMG